MLENLHSIGVSHACCTASRDVLQSESSSLLQISRLEIYCCLLVSLAEQRLQQGGVCLFYMRIIVNAQLIWLSLCL